MTLFDAGRADDARGCDRSFMITELKISLARLAGHLSRCVSQMAAFTLS